MEAGDEMKIDKVLFVAVVLVIVLTAVSLVLNVHPFGTLFEPYQIGVG